MRDSLLTALFGGEGGIRTPGGLASSTVFKTAAIDHSATSPSKIAYFFFARMGFTGRSLTSATIFATTSGFALRYSIVAI